MYDHCPDYCCCVLCTEEYERADKIKRVTLMFGEPEKIPLWEKVVFYTYVVATLTLCIWAFFNH